MAFQSTIHSFIGRQQEIEHFINWLDDPNTPWILYIYDATEEAEKKGGVGKTQLLHRYADIAHDIRRDIAIVSADFFYIEDRDSVLLAEKVVSKIQELYPEWTPDTFMTVVKQYKTATPAAESELSGIKLRETASASLAEDLRRLNTHLAAQHKTLLVFLDTFETIEKNPGIAVLRNFQTFPDTYGFPNIRVIMAGRNQLDWTHSNWRGRELEVRTMALHPFNQKEMLEYVETESIYEISHQTDFINVLYERTGGRPILIGLVTDVLNQRILTLKQLIAIPQLSFESYLVAQINHLDNPLNWIILFMAHVYHRFNMSILDWLMHEIMLDDPIQFIDPENLIKTLLVLSFVRHVGSGEDFVLHDEMRRLVVKYCWDLQDTDLTFRKDISRSIIVYYEQQQQEHIIEILYHRLFIDLEDGMHYLKEELYNALYLSKNTTARLLIQEAQVFRNQLSPAQSNELQFSEIMLLRAEEIPGEALYLLHELREHANPDWLKQNLSDLLLEEGRCYRQLGKYTEATNYFEQALAIEQAQGNEEQSAPILTVLGRIARRRGQFSTALKYYEQSIVIYKKSGQKSAYADTLMDIAVVYRNQGKIDDALRMCKLAGRILDNLFQEGKVSEILIGLNLVNLGQIYLSDGNTTGAHFQFCEAFDIYLRTNYKAGIAVTYNLFGHIQLHKNDLEEARKWFIKAENAAQNIDIEQYISSLKEQGRICQLQQQWNEATAFFEEAISNARSASDYYQQTECLIHLATILNYSQKVEQMQQILREAEKIAHRENYFNLLGWIEFTRGDIIFNDKDYKTAFQHFALYCTYMAQYNSSEFKKAVQKLIDALLNVPKDAIPSIVQDLLAYWTSHKLDEEYPEFMNIKEVTDTLMMF